MCAIRVGGVETCFADKSDGDADGAEDEGFLAADAVEDEEDEDGVGDGADAVVDAGDEDGAATCDA